MTAFLTVEDSLQLASGFFNPWRLHVFRRNSAGCRKIKVTLHPVNGICRSISVPMIPGPGWL